MKPFLPVKISSWKRSLNDLVTTIPGNPKPEVGWNELNNGGCAYVESADLNGQGWLKYRIFVFDTPLLQMEASLQGLHQAIGPPEQVTVRDERPMLSTIWIDGKKVAFRTAHVCFSAAGGKDYIDIPLFLEPTTSIRIQDVRDGDIHMDTPIIYSRWQHFARHG